MQNIKNVSPLGEIDVLLLGRIVKRGEVVEVSNEHAKELIRQGIFEPADDAKTEKKD